MRNKHTQQAIILSPSVIKKKKKNVINIFQLAWCLEIDYSIIDSYCGMS